MAGELKANEMMTRREQILRDAKSCICGDRDKEYGGPEDSFKVIADFWSTYLGVDISAMDVGVMMGLFKIGRIKTSDGNSRDSFVDLAGYAACAYECSSIANASATIVVDRISGLEIGGK